MSKDRRVDQYDGPLSLIHGFQRLKPVRAAASLPLVPRRIRYMYVDRLCDDGGRLFSQTLLKDEGVNTVKYESVKPSLCSPELVVICCSIMRNELPGFNRAMRERNAFLRSPLGVAGYADFCMGLQINAVMERQGCDNDSKRG